MDDRLIQIKGNNTVSSNNLEHQQCTIVEHRHSLHLLCGTRFCYYFSELISALAKHDPLKGSTHPGPFHS